MTRDALIDVLAEAQRYNLEIADPQVRADAIFDTLNGDDEILAWIYEHALDAFGEFEERCATGDFAAACELAETELLPILHDAVAAGRFNRGPTPDEIRSRNPHAFRTVAVVPRDHVRDWLGGRSHAQPVRAASTRAATATLPPARTGTRTRGAGRPRAISRASSRSGDSGDDGSGSSEGDGEPPPPGPLLFLVHLRFGPVNRALARVLRGLGQ